MSARSSGYGVGKSGTPAFDVRGIVEGFYGPPWSHAERLDMINFIADRGMNTFVYSPKDDPLMRWEWRAPYEGEELARLAELVDACARRGLEFVFCLSPGLSIQYSSEQDIATLLEKYAAVAELGVGWFGLLLDDIPASLQHTSDQGVWPDLVSAHVDLVGRVHAALAVAGHRLVVCPTQYFGRGTEDYITRLGQGVPAEVDLFWTGRLICSPFIDVEDAERFSHATGRPPLFWDNYPVNDVAMTHELHIGPYRGRDVRLAEASRGVIANGMEYAESSKIAFATIADYLWSPGDYDPEESWATALADLIPDAEDRADFRLFAENSLGSCLNLDDAPELVAVLERYTFLVETGDPQGAAAIVSEYAQRAAAASDRLLNAPQSNPTLVDEARAWITVFALGAAALADLARLTAEGTLDRDGATVLGEHRAHIRHSHRRVFGDALDMTLTDVIGHSTTTEGPTHKEAAP